MKVKDVCREYSSTRRFTKLSDSTKRHYISAMNDIEREVGDMEVDQVKRRDLIRAHEAMSDRPAIANRFSCVASIIFNYAVDMEYCGGNPAQRITPHKLGTWKRWEVADVDKMIASNHPIVSTAVALAFYTGQRESDVLKMKWEDIQKNVIRVKQRKTGTELEIPLAAKLKEYLDTIPRKGAYIVGNGNAPIAPNNFRNMFKRQAVKIGIGVPFHGIRKTVGSVLAEKGKTVNEIAALLGHKTLAMAALYTKQASDKKLIASAVTGLADD